MVVTATYDNDTSEVVSGYECSPNTALATTDESITITYSGKTTSVAITVIADSNNEE